MSIRLSVGSRLFLYMALFCLVNTKIFAQDPHFSQFFANPVYTNPAFAGSVIHGRTVISYRNQWSNISGKFVTSNASYDEHFSALNGGVGLMVTRDVAGIGLLTTTDVSGVYSYLITVNKYLSFRASVQASLMQKSLDFDNYTWGDQILKQRGIVKDVSNQPIPNPTVTITNFAAGFIGYTKYAYWGAAVHNLTEPSQSFFGNNAPIMRKITLHGGAQIPLKAESRSKKNNVSVSPNVLYMQQGDFSELNLGLYYNKGAYVLGTYFRQTTKNSDAVIFIIGLKREKLHIGYSFDATVSNARQGAPNSHEVTVAFELKKRNPKKPIRAITCPEF